MRIELSIKTVAFECAGTVNALAGKPVGESIPVDLTTCPAEVNAICMGGSASATSCQLFSCNTAPAGVACPIGCALFQRPPVPESAVFQPQLNAVASIRSAGSAT